VPACASLHGVTVVAEVFRPADADFLADPYPAYAVLRRDHPVVFDEAAGCWLVSRHADVSELLRDRRLGRVFTPRRPTDVFAAWNRLNAEALLDLEPPEHTRQRRLVSSAFTPRRVAALKDPVRQLADELLYAAVDGDRLELMAGLAESLPVAVIAELLGVPEEDRHRLRPWSRDIVGLYELAYDDAAEDRAVTAAEEFDAYLRGLIADRRRRSAADLLSGLVEASDVGDRLTEDEVVATAVLLLNAGHEATVNAIGNGVLALLRTPGSLDRLRDHRDLLPSAVEETIRYDTPLSMFQRTAFTDVDVAGQTVRAGERVGLLLGAANRDERAFPDPDALDIGRRDNPHVGLGGGIHYCLGAPLARLEIEVTLEALLNRFQRLELAAEPVRRPTFQFRGLTELQLAVR